jgi:UDP-N-acetylmuramate--alanine ligase
VLFQPHRYTRTRELLYEFAASFADADVLYLMDIYPAGEKPIEGVSSAAMAEAMRNAGQKNVTHIADRDLLVSTISDGLRPRDVFFTLGAGDVWKTGEGLLKRAGG